MSKGHLRDPGIDVRKNLQEMRYEGVDLNTSGSEQGQW
jgi:hypothetical protein